MENQPITNSSTSSVNSIPVSSSSVSTQAKSSLILPILVTTLISGIAFGFGGYYLGSQLNKVSPTPQNAFTSEEVNTTTPAITEMPTNKGQLADALSKYCLNNEIALDKLPFSLNQSIKSDYKLQSSIDCFVPDESYASISITVQTPDFNGDDRNIYFFHQGSKWMGQDNSFQALSNYHQISIDGNTYWLNVRDPDPYGISTSGIWIDMIGEKNDPASGTIVRAIDNEILKNEDLLDIVEKYGVKQIDSNSPEYIIIDPAKKAQFIQEIVNIAGQHSAFKTSAQNVTSDLKGVTF